MLRRRAPGRRSTQRWRRRRRRSDSRRPRLRPRACSSARVSPASRARRGAPVSRLCATKVSSFTQRPWAPTSSWSRRRTSRSRKSSQTSAASVTSSLARPQAVSLVHSSPRLLVARDVVRRALLRVWSPALRSCLDANSSRSGDSQRPLSGTSRSTARLQRCITRIPRCLSRPRVLASSSSRRCCPAASRPPRRRSSGASRSDSTSCAKRPKQTQRATNARAANDAIHSSITAFAFLARQVVSSIIEPSPCSDSVRQYGYTSSDWLCRGLLPVEPVIPSLLCRTLDEPASLMGRGLLAPVVDEMLAAAEPPASGSLLQLHAAPLHATLPLSPPLRPAEPLPQWPAKLSKYKRRKLLKAQARARMYERWRLSVERFQRESAEKREREKRLKRWFARGAYLPPHMTRRPPALPEVERPELAVAEVVESKLGKTLNYECGCTACRRVFHDRGTVHDQYKCRIAHCQQKFDDFIEFVDHQVDVHGAVYVNCARVREELYRSQASNVFPPATVFILDQYVNQGELPSMWTLEQADQEAAALESRLRELRSSGAGIPLVVIRGSFRAAYERVKRYGISELKEQYRVALEHHEASLVHAVGPRNRQDGVSTIRAGRNWLLSVEPENAEKARAIKFQRGDDLKQSSESDEESEEEEVVLEFCRAGKTSYNKSEVQTPSPVKPNKQEASVVCPGVLETDKVAHSKLVVPQASEEPEVIFL